MVLAVPARADAPAVALNVGDSCVLIAADGTELVPQGQYSNIEPVSDQAPYYYAAYQMDGDEPEFAKLLDANGQPLTDFSYDYFSAVGDKICFGQDGLYGVMDAEQKIVVPCNYTSIVSNGEGGYLALTTDPYDERPDGVYYIDAAGKETATGIRILYGLTDFSNGLMPVLSADTGRSGYLNPKGEWAISPQFSYAGSFVGSIADAAIDSGTGLIDASGNWLITPKYETLSLGGQTPVVVAQADSTAIDLIDPKTMKTLRSFTGKDIYFAASPDSPLVTLYLDDRMVLVGADGSEILESKGTEGSAEADDAAVVLREGPWGEKNATLCDLSGKRLAGPYQDIWRVSAVANTPYYAFSSFETQTEKLDDGTPYLNEVPDTRVTGLMDKSGVTVWQPGSYRELYSPAEGLFTVQMPGKAGVMKADGTWLKVYDIAPEQEG